MNDELEQVPEHTRTDTQTDRVTSGELPALTLTNHPSHADKNSRTGKQMKQTSTPHTNNRSPTTPLADYYSPQGHPFLMRLG